MSDDVMVVYDDPAEQERIRRWRECLVEDMGEDLRSCVRYMHPDPEGLKILLDLAKRFRTGAVVQQSIRIYWHMLTQEANQREGKCGR